MIRFQGNFASYGQFTMLLVFFHAVVTGQIEMKYATKILPGISTEFLKSVVSQFET